MRVHASKADRNRLDAQVVPRGHNRCWVYLFADHSDTPIDCVPTYPNRIPGVLEEATAEALYRETFADIEQKRPLVPSGFSVYRGAPKTIYPRFQDLYPGATP